MWEMRVTHVIIYASLITYELLSMNILQMGIKKK